jgi:DNA processing protein
MTSRFELRPVDPAYPGQLLQGVRPPKVLYGIGDPSTLVPGLAIIGSRTATPYGLACARNFARWAAEMGVTVISGAAIGCDLAAQTAALDAGAPTVAVLGCGADVDYPRRASEALARIRGGAGAVVSELAWGTPPLPGHFPARNRIIAGLASAVLVVEAALPSGTFSTADSALDSGRDVLAVPGSILYPGSAGSNRLIRQGADPITCVEDLRDALAAAGLVESPSNGGGRSGMPTPFLQPSDDPVLQALRAHPMSPDAASEALGLALPVLLATLARLEAAGLVARHTDGRYGPCVPA